MSSVKLKSFKLRATIFIRSVIIATLSLEKTTVDVLKVILLSKNFTKFVCTFNSRPWRILSWLFLFFWSFLFWSFFSYTRWSLTFQWGRISRSKRLSYWISCSKWIDWFLGPTSYRVSLWLDNLIIYGGTFFKIGSRTLNTFNGGLAPEPGRCEQFFLLTHVRAAGVIHIQLNTGFGHSFLFFKAF